MVFCTRLAAARHELPTLSWSQRLGWCWINIP